MSSRQLKIRDFRFEDLETLYRMDQTCFAEGIAFSEREIAFYASHPRSITRVAEQQSGISGFILARIEARSKGHLITLDVDPGTRRCGIGTALMSDMHREFVSRNIAVSVLEVAVDNAPAQALYRKFGYRETGTLMGYYRGSEDAYQMQLELGSANSGF